MKMAHLFKCGLQPTYPVICVRIQISWPKKCKLKCYIVLYTCMKCRAEVLDFFVLKQELLALGKNYTQSVILHCFYYREIEKHKHKILLEFIPL